VNGAHSRPRPRRLAICAAVLCCALGLPGVARADPPAANADKTGLALSAGSAAGLSHIGVLAALEAQGIRIDAIAGTSMGAVIGALYASGSRAADIEREVGAVNWQALFSRSAERPLVPLSQRLDLIPAIGRVGVGTSGISLPVAFESDFRVNRLLIKLLTAPGLAAHGDFDSLPIPYRAVTADLETGERVVLSRGNLARAVRASMAIPVLLPPVEDSGRTLVDGGIVDGFPVGVARAMGAGTVIGVDARPAPLEPSAYRDALGMAEKVVEVLSTARGKAYAQSPDILIAPDVAHVAAADYHDYARIIALGRKAADSVLAASGDRLRRGPAADHAPPLPAAVLLDEIEVRGNHRVREELIRETFRVHPTGHPMAMDDVLHGMDALHATRLFDSIWVDFAPVGTDRTRATVEVQETWPWGLEGGVSYTEADQVGGFVRLRNRNLFGFGESLAVTGAASDSELRAHAQYSSPRLFTPLIGSYAKAWAWEDRPRFFAAHDEVGRVDFDRFGVAAGLQRPMGPSVLVRAGGALERIATDELAAAGIAHARERIAAVQGTFAWDELDDLYFPTRGFNTTLAATNGWRHDLDTDRSRDYWRVAATGRAAHAFGSRTVLEWSLLAGAAGGDVPAHELFRIGGPTVPGLYREELWNRQAAAAEIACRFRVWRSFQITGRAGAGDAWADWDMATLEALERGFGLGLEAPTRIGPLSLVWGSGDESRIYFTVGYRQYPMTWLLVD
jgi:NTE family protein